MFIRAHISFLKNFTSIGPAAEKLWCFNSFARRRECRTQRRVFCIYFVNNKSDNFSQEEKKMLNKIFYKDICFKNTNFNFSKKSVRGQPNGAEKFYIPLLHAAVQLWSTVFFQYETEGALKCARFPHSD